MEEDDIKRFLERLGIDSFDLLDNVPVPISVQNDKQVVVYENKAMKEAFGSQLHNYCYKRWNFLEGYGNEKCKDCPALVAISKRKNYSVIRKAETKDNKKIFVKITHVPLDVGKSKEKINYYMELVEDVTQQYLYRLKSRLPIEKLREELWISLTTFGNFGGEVISTEELPFVGKEELRNFLLEMSLYLFTGIGQGDNYNVGLYGFLPVLNKENYIVLVYSFRYRDEKLKDKRLKQMDYALFMIFTKIENENLINYKNEIEEFLNGSLSCNCVKKDFTLDFMLKIKTELLDLIKKLEKARNKYLQIAED